MYLIIKQVLSWSLTITHIVSHFRLKTIQCIHLNNNRSLLQPQQKWLGFHCWKIFFAYLVDIVLHKYTYYYYDYCLFIKCDPGESNDHLHILTIKMWPIEKMCINKSTYLSIVVIDANVICIWSYVCLKNMIDGVSAVMLNIWKNNRLAHICFVQYLVIITG